MTGLRPARRGPSPDAGYRLIGAGPVGQQVARLLVASGIGELHIFDDHPPELDLYPSAGVLGTRSESLRSALAGRSPGVVTSLTHWSRPEGSVIDLTVVAADGPEIDRTITDHLVRLDHPHLVIRSLGNGACVGPLVLAGRTSCLRCHDLTRRDADRQWPVVLEQLSRVRLEMPEAVAAWAAAYASSQALAFLNGARAGTRRSDRRTAGAGLHRTTAVLARTSQLRVQLAQPDRMGGVSDQRDDADRGAVDRRSTGGRERNAVPRSSFRRGARLASLPLGFAGRATVGLGRRLGGTPAEQVSVDLQQRAAEQLFRVLGELKGGAMKFGQALSLFESMLPEEVAAPYRAQLARLQDAAPPMPTSRVHAVLTRELGGDWRQSFTSFDAFPAAAASIGQVHRATWHDGRTVAVKVQYPGADDALRSDLKQIGRLSKVVSPLAGGVDVSALVEELTARVSEELDYTLEGASQQQAAEGFAGSAEFFVPHVLASTTKVMVSEWVEGAPLSSAAELTDDERNEIALRYVRFLFAGPSTVGLLHADPHPGNFKILADGRLGVVDFGLVARMPEGLPSAMGRILRIAQHGEAHEVVEGLRVEGFIVSDVDADDLMDYLAPFVEPASVPEFQFNRDWMREQFIRVRDPQASGGVAMKLNLPPSYLLIHRVWLGGLAVLSQLNARAAFRAGAGGVPSRVRGSAVNGLQRRVECAACGRSPKVDEPDGAGGVPWTWSTAQEDGQTSVLCDHCTREHARSIEAKLDADWW